MKQESGQFFTPVPIARFIIKSLPFQEITEQKIEQGNKNDLLPAIIDYAAGSGHFITESMEVVQNFIDGLDENKFNPTTKKSIKKWKEDQFDWAETYVYGIEKDYRLVKTAKVSCYLHGDGLAKVIHGDGLGDFATSTEFKDLLKETDKTYPQDNKQFDVIISNPPYSVSAFKGSMVTEEKAKKAFDLYSRLTDQSSEIECLFIERTKQLLKDGGVAGIILPSSILSNTGIYTQTREILLKYFDVLGITELGSGTFMATGTNTVTLFLKRRNNADAFNIEEAIKKFFTNLQDVTINGIEKPVQKYISHVWNDITFEDYVSLLKKEPNSVVKKHEIYQEYQSKIKAKNDQEKWNSILALEQDKLLYYIIALPQKLVLVKTGEKKEEKRFLGYEFSNRRGNEGIHSMQRGKAIDDCTQLYDADSFVNPEKASTYIYKAFKGEFDLELPSNLQKNISYHNLVDMLTFDRVVFEKSISLSVKKKVKIDSKWGEKRFDKIAQIVKGVTYSKGDQANEVTDSIILTADNITLDGKLELAIDKKVYLNNDFQISEDKKLKKNDIFICFSSGSKEHLGKVAFISNNTNNYAGGFMGIIRVNNENEPKYIYQLLNTLLRQTIRDIGSGSNINNLSGIINEIKIPLPPKDIQEKIVAGIEVLEKQETKVNNEIEKLKESIRTILNATDKKTILKNLLEDINPSKSETILNLEDNTNVSFLSMSDVSNDGEVINLQKRLLKEVKTGFTFFQKDDVLFAKITPCMENGKGALVSDLESNIGFGSTEFFVLRVNKEKLLPKILFYFTQSKELRINAEKEMTGASGHRRVPKSFIETYEIPFFTLSEQKKIVIEIEKIENKIANLEKELNLIPKQKEQILKKYLE